MRNPHHIFPMPPNSISAIRWPRISTNCGADISGTIDLNVYSKAAKKKEIVKEGANHYNYWIWLWQQQ
jgi:hypothetical protein